MTQTSLHADLSRLTTGEVYTDAVNREVYATAACIFRQVPQAVVCPRSEEEVAALIRYAHEQGLPVTARGAGSSVAGQALGEGLLIDLARHLNRTLDISASELVATVQPGRLLAKLNRELAPFGLFFPPDPSSAEYATLGGMIANNSSGAHSIKYGDTRRWVQRLKVVLADGSVHWIEPEPLPLQKKHEGLLGKIYTELPGLLDSYQGALQRSRPQVAKNSSGYHVWDLVEGNQINLTPLLVGSEGTLAVTLQAVLKLMPLPGGRAVSLLSFSSLSRACQAVEELLSFQPAALEIMDDLFLSLVREHRPDLRHLLPQSGKALLLLEFEAESQKAAEWLLAQAGEKIFSVQEKEESMLVARTESEIAQLFAVRQAASPILYRLPGRRLTRFIEDVVLPRERLAEGITKIQEILSRHGTNAPLLGHAGSGNLHLNPRLDLTDPRDRELLPRIAEEIYSLVISLGGSISGEHGDGLLRTAFVSRQFPELMPLFSHIKELFDPQKILNPEKIISSRPGIPMEYLRFKPREEEKTTAVSLLKEPGREMLLRCHGCGLCRSYCPVVAATEEEASLPRAKVSVLRAVAHGELETESAEERTELMRILSLCTGCQRCLSGCPTGIETPRLIRAFLAEQGPPPRFREKFFARSPELLRLGAKAPKTISALTQNSLCRRLMERAWRINSQAGLPLPAGDLFQNQKLRQHSREKERQTDQIVLSGGVVMGRDEGKIRAGEKAVVFYPGCLGRFADGEKESLAAIEILRFLGYNVHLPELPCCGEPELQLAHLEPARNRAQEMIRLLSPYTGAGLNVVTTCPTCALVFQHEYPALLGDRAQTLSRLTSEFFAFFNQALSEQDLKPSFGPAPFPRAVLHQPCHAAARSALDQAKLALSFIPGLSLLHLEGACCGLAGVFGLREENKEVAAALGHRLVQASEETGTREVISSCPACRFQMQALGLVAQSAVKVLRHSLLGQAPAPAGK